MIGPAYSQTMAQYNTWQNNSLNRGADVVGDAALRLDRGAFYRSIQATLSHILWGDGMLMSRFDGWDKPATNDVIDVWDARKMLRLKADATDLGFMPDEV